jgi:hypothetical protein
MKSPRNFLLVVFTLGTSIFLLSNSGGAIAESTGAPREQTCGRSSCHNVASNQGNATIDVEFPDNGTKYQAGKTYALKVSIANAEAPLRNGFQIVALDAQSKNVGEWILTDAANTQIENGFTNADRRYVTHTSSGNRVNSWTMSWKAPASNVGNITFYLAVIDGNSNGSNSEDMLYTTTKLIGFDTVSSTKEVVKTAVLLLENPVNQFIQLKSNDYINTAYQLFDANGKLMRQGKLANHLDVSTFNNGIYFLEVLTPRGRIVEKMVIANR